MVTPDAEIFTRSLPSIDELLQRAWPCLADIFCAESTSVHGHFRLPVVSKRDADDILAWADAVGAILSDVAPDVTTSTLRDSRRRQRMSHPVAAPTVRQRRRSVRRWAPNLDQTVGEVATTTTTTTPDINFHQIPDPTLQMLRWLDRILREVWVTAGAPGRPDILEAIETDPLRCPLLRSLLAHTVQIVRHLSAHSSRNDTLRWLYTAVVWHLAGPSASHSYMQRLLLPQFLDSSVCGIPGIVQIIVHRDADARPPVWYVGQEFRLFFPRKHIIKTNACREHGGV